jgi:hypothetical protein
MWKKSVQTYGISSTEEGAACSVFQALHEKAVLSDIFRGFDLVQPRRYEAESTIRVVL